MCVYYKNRNEKTKHQQQVFSLNMAAILFAASVMLMTVIPVDKQEERHTEIKNDLYALWEAQERNKEMGQKNEEMFAQLIRILKDPKYRDDLKTETIETIKTIIADHNFPTKERVDQLASEIKTLQTTKDEDKQKIKEIIEQ